MLNDTKQLREDVNDDELLKSANHSMINNSLLEIVNFNSDNNANCNDVDNEMIVRVDSNESKNKKDKAKSKERDAKDANTINTTRKESKKKNDNVSNATIKKILNTTKMKLKENIWIFIAVFIWYSYFYTIYINMVLYKELGIFYSLYYYLFVFY